MRDRFYPYLLGQIGLVGNSWVNCSAIVDWLSPYLLGQIGLVGNFRRSNWLQGIPQALPIRSNRISWKREWPARPPRGMPYLLGQIGLVGNAKA